MRRWLAAASREVGGHPQQVIDQLGSLHIAQLDACIHHGHLVSDHVAMHPTQGHLPQPLFTGIFGMDAFKGQRAGDPLSADLAHFANHAKYHGWQCPFRPWVIMLACSDRQFANAGR